MKTRASFLSLTPQKHITQWSTAAPAGSVLWISGKLWAEDKYKGSFHCCHSVFRKEVLEVPIIFPLGEKEVLFAAISDRLFSCMFWVHNCLGRVHQLRGRTVPEPFQLMLASGICSSDYFLLLVNVWEGFWKDSALGSMKAYLSKEQTHREMFIKQMYSFCLETCPAVPVLNIKNKLSCQGKNIMHNLILIFHAV